MQTLHHWILNVSKLVDRIVVCHDGDLCSQTVWKEEEVSQVKYFMIE
jgi:hypothetical protein